MTRYWKRDWKQVGANDQDCPVRVIRRPELRVWRIEWRLATRDVWAEFDDMLFDSWPVVVDANNPHMLAAILGVRPALAPALAAFYQREHYCEAGQASAVAAAPARRRGPSVYCQGEED